MIKEEDILYDEQDEEQDISVQRNIRANAADAQVDSLHKRYTKQKLVVHPPYQRNFVWDAKKASLLIESVLMNIPVPMIYLAANADGKTNVIDGQQRLTTMLILRQALHIVKNIISSDMVEIVIKHPEHLLPQKMYQIKYKKQNKI